MAALSQQIITKAGITPSYAAAAASDTFPPGDHVFAQIKNASGTADTVTISVLAGDPPGLSVADLSISVGAAGDKMIGPLPAQFFADPSTGLGTIAHSFTTSVTIGIFNLQPSA